MKGIVLENIFNQDKFECTNLHDVETIEGVQYLKVHRQGSVRLMLMRKDALKKVQNKQVK